MSNVSQNGWPVLDVGQTRLWVIPGTNRSIRLQDGHAGFVLAHLLLWFNDVIEAIGLGIYDDWGWADRTIRGSSTEVSNHASGTAADINATRHPLGVTGTFAFAWNYAKVRTHLVFLRGVVRWGADYQGRKDEMHFEINRGPDAVRRLAKRLAQTKRGKIILAANPGYQPPIVHMPGTRDLHEGCHGVDVQFVQRKVGAPVDGDFGPKTTEKVRIWERAHKPMYPNLTVDGRVGKITWRALGVKVKY